MTRVAGTCRVRVESMERQLANLTGMVHKALNVPRAQRAHSDLEAGYRSDRELYPTRSSGGGCGAGGEGRGRGGEYGVPVPDDGAGGRGVLTDGEGGEGMERAEASDGEEQQNK